MRRLSLLGLFLLPLALGVPSAAAQPGLTGPGGAGAAIPGGGAGTGRMVDQIERSVTRPLPPVAPRAAPRDPAIWVPDRWVSIPGEPRGVFVPGHWERRLPSGDVHVPPVTVERPSTGTFQTFPGGVKPPVEERRQEP